MSSSIFTGIIEGGLTFDNSGTPNFAPWGNRVGECQLQYTGELTFAETFSGNGISGKSNACLVKEDAIIKVMSEDITWSFLQQSTASLAAAYTAPVPVQYTIDFPSTGTTTSIPFVPVVGQPLYVADNNGDQFTVSYATSLLTFPAGLNGKSATIFGYEVAPTTAESIALGSSKRISEVSAYGRFRGCGSLGDLLWFTRRATIKPSLDLNVSTGNKGKAGLELQTLRDSTGTYITLIRL
jgi:hypothetical protein